MAHRRENGIYPSEYKTTSMERKVLKTSKQYFYNNITYRKG